MITFPEGTFLLGDGPPLQVPSHSLVRGAGAQTVLRRAPATTAFALLTNAVYGKGTLGAEDITIRDLTFDSDGGAQRPAYAESRHAIALIGARSTTVTRCHFRRLSGDGIYVGSTADGVHRTTTPRQIRISDCTFEGSGRGRNGISLIDVEDSTIVGNNFLDVAGPGMPGGVDLEPNAASETIMDVLISGNTFRGCRQGIQVYNAAGARVGRITIRDNVIHGARDGGHAIFTVNVAALAVIHNFVQHVSGSGSGIHVERCPSAALSHNSIEEVSNVGIWLVQSDDGEISRNLVTDAAADAIRLSGSERAMVLSNHARYWGRKRPGSFAALHGLAGSTGAEVKDNTFVGDGSRGTTAVAADDGTTAWIIGTNAVSGVEIPYRIVGAVSRAVP